MRHSTWHFKSIDRGNVIWERNDPFLLENWMRVVGGGRERSHQSFSIVKIASLMWEKMAKVVVIMSSELAGCIWYSVLSRDQPALASPCQLGHRLRQKIFDTLRNEEKCLSSSGWHLPRCWRWPGPWRCRGWWWCPPSPCRHGSSRPSVLASAGCWCWCRRSRGQWGLTPWTHWSCDCCRTVLCSEHDQELRGAGHQEYHQVWHSESLQDRTCHPGQEQLSWSRGLTALQVFFRWTLSNNFCTCQIKYFLNSVQIYFTCGYFLIFSVASHITRLTFRSHLWHVWPQQYFTCVTNIMSFI